MRIDGTCGKGEVRSLEELHQLLRCREGDFGEFCLGGESFPVLAIHTRGDLAYLHFFSAERHPGFQAAGDVISGEDVIFKQRGHGDFSMPRAFTVSIEQAYRAAVEFFTSLKFPQCVRWIEL